jgi:hypothetical protein
MKVFIASVRFHEPCLSHKTITVDSEDDLERLAGNCAPLVYAQILDAGPPELSRKVRAILDNYRTPAYGMITLLMDALNDRSK